MGGGLVLPSVISSKDITVRRVLWLPSGRSRQLIPGLLRRCLDIARANDFLLLGNKAVKLTVAGGRITSLFG